MQHKITKILAAGCLAALCGSAFASTCTQDAVLTAATTGGDSCSGTNQLVLSCGDSTPIGGAQDFIYSVTLGSNNNATFTVHTAAFNPYIALMSGASCNSTNGCGAFENLGNANADVAIGPTANAAAGQYWLLITDAGANACGAFTLGIVGALPVQLQNFSVD